MWEFPAFIFKLIIWAISLAGIITSFLVIIFLNLPDVTKLKDCLKTTMNQVLLCPKNKDYVRLKQIAHHLKHSVVISEDAGFYSHSGFDWFELQQSFQTNIKNGKFKRGGSTITQQLAKNVFLEKDKSILRKIKEAYLTVQLEKYFSKDEIIEKYLNVVELGNKIYGVKAASHFYFKKEPKDLNILESAFLTYLLPNPKFYSLSFKKGHLTAYTKKKLLRISSLLLQHNKITEADYEWVKHHLEEFPWHNMTLPPVVEQTKNTEDNPETLELQEEMKEEEQALDEELSESESYDKPISDKSPSERIINLDKNSNKLYDNNDTLYLDKPTAPDSSAD